MYNTISSFEANLARDPTNIVETKKQDGRIVGPLKSSYISLAKLLARHSRPGTTQDGSGNKAENYSSISATNQHQLRQKMYQLNLQSFFV